MNILLIAPLTRFKTCISKNRVQLIKYLSSYNNIFFYDDTLKTISINICLI